jgi:hypothetical protein
MRTETTETTSTRELSFVPVLNRLRNGAGVACFIGLIVMIIAFVVDPSRSAGESGFWSMRAFWSSYYYGWTTAMSLTIGCLTLLFLHNAIRAQWGLAILRLLESGTTAVPFMFVGMLPILFGIYNHQIYPWADPAVVQHYDLLHRRTADVYLNFPWFFFRQCVYFGFWTWASWRLRVSSLQQDTTRDERLALQRASFGAAFGVVHVLVTTLYYTDTLMSLADWTSTLYAFWNITRDNLLTLGLLIYLVTTFQNVRPWSLIMTREISRDLGNFMLGWVMFWGYMSISQFLIIWSGNLPDDNSFYVSRFAGGLVFVGAFLIFFQFFGPFVSLINGRAKRTPEILRLIAAWMFLIRLLDNWWDVVPYFRYGIPHPGKAFAFDPMSLAFDFGALLLWVGLWLWKFSTHAALLGRQNALYPTHDPRLLEAKEMLIHAAH